ncbi:Hypothetical predicted protein, partial [Paramuricea clavata]
ANVWWKPFLHTALGFHVLHNNWCSMRDLITKKKEEVHLQKPAKDNAGPALLLNKDNSRRNTQMFRNSCVQVTDHEDPIDGIAMGSPLGLFTNFHSFFATNSSFEKVRSVMEVIMNMKMIEIKHLHGVIRNLKEAFVRSSSDTDAELEME